MAIAEHQESQKLFGQLKKNLQSSIQRMETDVNDLSEKQVQRVLSFTKQTKFLSTSTTAADGSFHVDSTEGAYLFAFVPKVENRRDVTPSERSGDKNAGTSERPLLWLIPIQKESNFINLGFEQNSWGAFIMEKS
jgi:hypothetical protein